MKFTHSCITTHDVDRLRAFYREVLKIEPDSGEGSIYVEFHTEGGILALYSFKAQDERVKGSSIPATNRCVSLQFLVEDVDKEYERLMKLNIEWVKPPTTQEWGNRSIWFRDPDGNLINFYTRVDQ